MDLNEIDAWIVSQRRAAGLRSLAVGLVLCVPTLLWLVVLGGWTTPDGSGRAKVMAVMSAAIGVCLTAVGAFWLARASRGIDPAVPTATAKRRR